MRSKGENLMEINVVPRDVNHFILEVKERADDNGKAYLTWDYLNATHFLILKRSVSADDADLFDESFRRNLSLQLNELFDIRGEVIASDSDLLDGTKVSIISFNEYRRKNRWYFNPSPMRIIIICCEQKGNEFNVYMPDNVPNCATFIPERIHIKVWKGETNGTQKLKGLKKFFGQKEAPSASCKYNIEISKVSEHYKGGIYYKLSGKNYKFPVPITKEMTGTTFSVVVPNGMNIEFLADNKIKKNYIISQEEKYSS